MAAVAGEAYLRYAAKPYNRVLGNKPNVTIVECKKDGIVVRQIKIFPENDRYIVEEYQLTEDKKTGKLFMHIVHCNVHVKYSYARSEFVGRVCVAAHENVNNEGGSEMANMFVLGKGK